MKYHTDSAETTTWYSTSERTFAHHQEISVFSDYKDLWKIVMERVAS